MTIKTHTVFSPRLSNESYIDIDATMCDVSYIDARRGTQLFCQKKKKKETWHTVLASRLTFA